MTDTNEKQALERAKADAIETAAALGDLVEGMQAVKRILECPIDRENCGGNTVHESTDADRISELSNKLVGLLGSELLGLVNAAQMVKNHTKLREEEDSKMVQDLHRTRDLAQNLHRRVDRAESISLRLKAEKKLLCQEVRALREDRRRLVEEVKSMRKIIRRTEQLDAWRLSEDQLRIHESVLINKTFTSGFAGIDPPGMKEPNNAETEDSNNQNSTRALSPSGKVKIIQQSYFPCTGRQKYEEVKNDRVLKYTPGKSNRTVCTSQPKPTFESPSDLTTSKERDLPFSKGIGNSLSTTMDRFKNALQEASDQRIHRGSKTQDQRNLAMAVKHEQTQRLPPPKPNQTRPNCSLVENNTSGTYDSTTPSQNFNDCKALDDEATKSTKSCSFDIDATMNSGEINSGVNLSNCMISCSDDAIPNDLALQVSIDEGSSFFHTDYSHSPVDLSSRPPMMITPDSSPIIGHSTTLSKSACDRSVLRTLAIPNENTRKEAGETVSALKPRLRPFHETGR